MQPRTPTGLLDDARILDLSIKLINVINADAAHEGTLFRYEIGKQEELHLKLPSAENQLTVVTVGELEPKPAVEGDCVIEVTRRKIWHRVIGHVASLPITPLTCQAEPGR